MKLRVTFKSAEFIGRGKIEAMLEDWMERHVKPSEKFRGFAEKELSATISKQDDEESFSIKLHMHVPPNTILVARGEANHFQPATEKALETLLRHYVNHIDRMRYQDANKRQSRRSRLESLRDQQDALSNELITEAGTNIESLLPKLEGAIRRELTFLRSQGDLPYSYPTTHDILDEVIASAISDWKPGIDSQAAYIRLLQEMHKILNREVGARRWTLKHQYIYLHAFDTGKSLRQGLGRWIGYYNYERGHSALDDRTPDEVYCGLPHPFAQAA